MERLFGYLHDLRWVIFAFVGGGVGYLLRSDEIKLKDLTIESIGAGFVGAIVSMIASYYELGSAETGILVGVSALIGARTTLGLITQALKGRLKLPVQENDNGKSS